MFSERARLELDTAVGYLPAEGNVLQAGAIHAVPHGVHATPGFPNKADKKVELGLQGKTVLLTLGYQGPDKVRGRRARRCVCVCVCACACVCMWVVVVCGVVWGWGEGVAGGRGGRGVRAAAGLARRLKDLAQVRTHEACAPCAHAPCRRACTMRSAPWARCRRQRVST